MNLIFAGVAFTGGALLLRRQPSPARPRLDIPGVLLVSGAVFCLVYGFSNAATHGWATPSTYGFLAAGVVLGLVFAWWQGRAAHPLLPPRVVLDRNRGGAYLSMLIASAGLFGIFFFLTYYLQQTLGVLPAGDRRGVPADQRLLGGRVQPVHDRADAQVRAQAAGHVRDAGRVGRVAVWLARLGLHTGYAAGVLGPLILAGIGLGLVIAPVINTGTFGVAPQDAGVASATVTVGQQLGASIGTSLLNTIFAGAVASYLTANTRLGPSDRPPGPDRAGAGPRLRHRVLVDRRDLRRRRSRRRHPAPPRAAGPQGHAVPGTRRGNNGTSAGEPSSTGVIRRS